jgi:hypothetical protein
MIRTLQKKSVYLVVCAIAVLLCGIVFWYGVLRPVSYRMDWSKRVRKDLRELIGKRPADIPPGQWEFAVGWTLNLHANCAAYATTSLDELELFEERLEAKLRGRVDLTTIDWIWDEYERITDCGKRYSDKYRPTKSPVFQEAAEGCFGLGVK